MPVRRRLVKNYLIGLYVNQLGSKRDLGSGGEPAEMIIAILAVESLITASLSFKLATVQYIRAHSPWPPSRNA